MTRSDMSDHTVKRIDEVEAVYGGGFLRLRAALGVRSFGMQIIELPPGFDGHPEHDHLGTGQEEVYVVLNGSGEIEVDGERISIDRETFVRVGPATRRKLYAGSDGLRALALGGVPGEAYRPPHFTELGASDLTAELPDAERRRLLADPECPVEVEPGGRHMVRLSDFHQIAEKRFGEIDGMEERLDQFLTHIGGSLLRDRSGIAFAFSEAQFAEVRPDWVR
jgi:mannose-6-phosphate isomerase-like protein (cupin superfamily)